MMAVRMYVGLLAVLALLLAACNGSDETAQAPDTQDDQPTAEPAPGDDDDVTEAPAEPVCPTYTVLTGDDDNQRSAFYALEEGIVTSDIIGELQIDYTTIPGLIAAVGTGQYDATLTSTPGVVLAREGGVDLQVLGVQLSHTGGGVKMFVRDDSDLQSGDDLAGMTIGVTAFGSTATLADRIILSQDHGLDSNLEGGDVTWVELDPPTLIAALLSGDVDAASLFHNFGWEALENPELRILIESDTRFQEITGEYVAGAAFVVEVDQLEEPGGRECAVEFRRMLLESVAYVENNLSEVAAAIAPVSGVPAEFIEYWWQPENHEYGGGIDDVWLDRAQNVWDEAYALEILPEPPDIREIIIED